MSRHRPPAEIRLVRQIRMSVELREVLLEREEPQGEHERLVAVIPGTEIPFSESMRQGDLGHLFAVPENAEFGFAGEDLLAGYDAGPAAAMNDAVIVEDSFAVGFRMVILHCPVGEAG